jgi:hypothetical protein
MLCVAFSPLKGKYWDSIQCSSDHTSSVASSFRFMLIDAEMKFSASLHCMLLLQVFQCYYQNSAETQQQHSFFRLVLTQFSLLLIALTSSRRKALPCLQSTFPTLTIGHCLRTIRHINILISYTNYTVPRHSLPKFIYSFCLSLFQTSVVSWS